MRASQLPRVENTGGNKRVDGFAGSGRVLRDGGGGAGGAARQADGSDRALTADRHGARAQGDHQRDLLAAGRGWHPR